ncbi:hypothetical protein BSFA1_15170 [Burkholderia sp. SFA1]|nr:hypothetical protein BSFA1_15170 [Burkholderia sp. SFA1]
MQNYIEGRLKVAKSRWRFPEAEIQLHRIANGSKVVSSSRKSAERRASAKAEEQQRSRTPSDAA